MIPEPTLRDNAEYNVGLLEMLDIDIRPQDQLVAVDIPPSHNPAAVHIASLGEGSRRTMLGALDLSARVLTRGLCEADTFPWWQLRKIHTNALRGWLISHRHPSYRQQNFVRGPGYVARRLG